MTKRMPFDEEARARLKAHGHVVIDAFVSFAAVDDEFALLAPPPTAVARAKLAARSFVVTLPKGFTSEAAIDATREFGHALDVAPAADAKWVTCRTSDPFAAGALLRACFTRLVRDLRVPASSSDDPTRPIPPR